MVADACIVRRFFTFLGERTVSLFVPLWILLGSIKKALERRERKCSIAGTKRLGDEGEDFLLHCLRGHRSPDSSRK
jgi:hypothetical protein